MTINVANHPFKLFLMGKNLLPLVIAFRAKVSPTIEFACGSLLRFFQQCCRANVSLKSRIWLSALVIIFGLYWLVQGEAASGRSQYLTAPADMGDLRRVVTATGTLNATINVEVGSQLSGQIA